MSERVTPDDPRYREQARLEAEFWAKSPITLDALEGSFPETVKRFINRSLTGDPSISWLEDLSGRGPYRLAAALGSTEGFYEQMWLRSAASESLDIYDLSSTVIKRTRTALRALAPEQQRTGVQVRFIQADLNFISLPRDRYDVVWSTGCIHHVINLEHLFLEVRRSLRENGLFALFEYVGERRLEYDAARLRFVNEVFRHIPARFHAPGVDAIRAPADTDRSPFEAVRSNEIMPVAQECFPLVYAGWTGALFPLFYCLQLDALERERPDILEKILEADLEACRDLRTQPCLVYAVFRKPKTSERKRTIDSKIGNER